MSSLAARALAYWAEDPWLETHFEQRVGPSLTVYLAENEDLVVTLGEVKAVRKGTGHPTSQCRWPMTSVLSSRHFPNERVVYGLPLPLRYYVSYGTNFCPS